MSSFVANNVNNRDLEEESGASTEEQLLQDDVVAAPVTRVLMRRFVQPVAVLVVAAVLGYAGYAIELQTRLRAPVVGPAEDLTEAKDLHAFTELTMQRPMTERTHCVGNALLNRPTAYCNPQGTCCNNDHGWAYCCAAGNECYRNVCVAGPGQCFPGEAEVALADGSKKRIDELNIGEEVLVETPAGGERYEPVLAFLHQLPGRHESLTVEHGLGTFRVSANHLVFVQDAEGKRADKIAVQLKAGDSIYLPSTAGGLERVVEVISVQSSTVDSGMYAPLTASGTIIVDGIVASNYATHSQATWIPHSVIHAAFLPVRVYHTFGFGVQSKANVEKDNNEMHPYVDVLQRHVANTALQVLGQYK